MVFENDVQVQAANFRQEIKDHKLYERSVVQSWATPVWLFGPAGTEPCCSFERALQAIHA